MAAEGSRIDFMFLAPPPYPAAGSATGTLESLGMKLGKVPLPPRIPSSWVCYGTTWVLTAHDSWRSRGIWSPAHVFRCGLRSHYPAPVSVERFTPSNVWWVSHANTRLTMKPHCWCDVYLYYCLQGMMLRLHDVRSTWDAAHVIEDAHPTCVSETHANLPIMSR